MDIRSRVRKQRKSIALEKSRHRFLLHAIDEMDRIYRKMKQTACAVIGLQILLLGVACVCHRNALAKVIALVELGLTLVAVLKTFKYKNEIDRLESYFKSASKSGVVFK